MKIWVKISIAVAVMLVFFFSAVFIYFAAISKALLTEKIEQGFKEKITIGQQAFRIPLVLEMRDLKIGDLGKIDRASASLSLSGLLGGKIVLNELKIVNPEINWVREPAQGAIAENSSGLKESEKKKSQGQAQAIEEQQHSPIMIKHLSVENGALNFIDQTVSEAGIEIALRDVSLDVDNLYLFSQTPKITKFSLTAKMPWQAGEKEGTFYTSGWVNLYKKDMQARLELEGIDGVYLHPYYTQWINLEDAHIDEARLSLFSDIQGKNNDVVAQCRLELTDLKFKSRSPDEPENEAEKIATTVLGIFRALNQGKIVLNFTIKTKMYNPKIGLGNSIDQAMKETINEAIKSDKIDVALPPGKFVEDVTRGTKGATQAIIDTTFSVGRNLMNAVLGAIKSDKEEAKAQ